MRVGELGGVTPAINWRTKGDFRINLNWCKQLNCQFFHEGSYKFRQTITPFPETSLNDSDRIRPPARQWLFSKVYIIIKEFKDLFLCHEKIKPLQNLNTHLKVKVMYIIYFGRNKILTLFLAPYRSNPYKCDINGQIITSCYCPGY